jgi:DEAD/DEAH box helicase domain-containing protein
MNVVKWKTRPMDFGSFLHQYLTPDERAARLAHQEIIPARAARHASLQDLPRPVTRVLARQGIDCLYTHQAEAVSLVRAGENVLIVTSTASGKTLCYNLPVLEAIAGSSECTALYLFPTKALAQDQLRALRAMAEADPALAALTACGTYDGDTPGDERRRLRDKARIILTNPDMLHVGILPYHSRWHRFFSNLKFVVVDEIHVYRGIFGSHVANVMRRLRRIAAHYGANPQFIACSATIANPGELASRLIGAPVSVVDDDGSPKGPRHFLLWNPPCLDAAGMTRRSANEEASTLLTALVEQGVQTIAFTKTRLVAELLSRSSQETLAGRGSPYAQAVRSYRAGYLPKERREIENLLFSGELKGIVSTNALELGIDVGGLDACLIVGFPGTIASTWQQAGRAGRGDDEALVVLVAYNDPIDQYLMRHPDYFFGRSPEHGIIDPENPYVLGAHLRCAAFELPICSADEELFGDTMKPLAAGLESERALERIDQAWYFSTTDFPAAHVNLRTVSDNTFTIMDRSDKNRVVGTVDAISAPELVYPGGVYLHQGETYLVRDLDLNARAAYVERAEVDYYTQAVLEAQIRIQREEKRRALSSGLACWGQATVAWRTTAFKKIKFQTMETVGYGRVDLPGQSLETAALWVIPDPAMLARLPGSMRKAIGGLCGIRNVAVLVLALVAMCDRQDLGGIVESSNTGSPTVFLYDRYPGGMGFSEKGFELIDDLVSQSLQLIRECGCENGCPSCVGSPVTRPPQHGDPDLWQSAGIPDRRAAIRILELLAAGPAHPPTVLQGGSGPAGHPTGSSRKGTIGL